MNLRRFNDQWEQIIRSLQHIWSVVCVSYFLHEDCALYEAHRPACASGFLLSLCSLYYYHYNDHSHSHSHCSLFLLLCWHTTCVSVPQNESSALFGSFKHQASDSLRLWSVWDWTRLCCWAQGGLARSDDLTHKLHSARPRWCAALCLLHEVIRVGSCRAVCSILSCFIDTVLENVLTGH